MLKAPHVWRELYSLYLGCQKCETCVVGMNNICDSPNALGTDIGISPDNSGGYATHVPVPDCCYLIKVSKSINSLIDSGCCSMMSV